MLYFQKLMNALGSLAKMVDYVLMEWKVMSVIAEEVIQEQTVKLVMIKISYFPYTSFC